MAAVAPGCLLQMSHPGGIWPRRTQAATFSPRWKEPEVEDGKHGQLEHKHKCPPWLILGLLEKGTTPGESGALITLSSREEFHRRTAAARNSCLLPRSKPATAQHTVSCSDLETLSSSPISPGVKAKTMRRQRKGDEAACRSNFPELHFPPKD